MTKNSKRSEKWERETNTRMYKSKWQWRRTNQSMFLRCTVGIPYRVSYDDGVFFDEQWNKSRKLQITTISSEQWELVLSVTVAVPRPIKSRRWNYWWEINPVRRRGCYGTRQWAITLSPSQWWWWRWWWWGWWEWWCECQLHMHPAWLETQRANMPRTCGAIPIRTYSTCALRRTNSRCSCSAHRDVGFSMAWVIWVACPTSNGQPVGSPRNRRPPSWKPAVTAVAPTKATVMATRRKQRTSHGPQRIPIDSTCARALMPRPCCSAALPARDSCRLR